MISQLTSLDERAGTDLTGENNLDNVLERAGLNYNVEKVPMHTPEGNVVSDKYLLRREDNKFILGTCGKRYHVVDNDKMFEPFHSIVENCDATYESAGMVSHGKANWVSARLGNEFEVRDDKFQRRVIMLVYHNGMQRNSYFTYNHRVICNNMMSSLNATSRKHGIGVKHTPTWEANLNLAGEAFAESISDSSRFQSSMAILANTKMTSGQAAKFSKKFFLDFKTPEKVKKEEKSQRSKTRLKNKVDELVSLFEEGMGNEGKTRYDMFNAVTEYLDHHSVKKNTNNGRRFLSNLSGMQANKKRRAVKELMPMAA
jgi:phage/plasmid-like protein (TIGR03299 family)